MMDLLEKAQAILDAEHSSAYFDGRDEGIAEGIAEGIQRVARALLLEGDPPEKVARLTGLPLEQVMQM